MSETEGDLFDRSAEVLISEQHRPHWAQSNAITFITLRLADSIPAEVIRRWHRDRIEFLQRHGVQCERDWKAARELLDVKTRGDFDKQFERAREKTLDNCLGNCELRDPWAADQVAASLMRFDGDRYLMGDFVIMSNHVHCLVAFRNGDELRKLCGSWMRFTARKINHRMNRSGSLWYDEPFDHLVRSEAQLEYLREYIANNPVKAGLAKGQYLYRRSNRHF